MYIHCFKGLEKYGCILSVGKVRSFRERNGHSRNAYIIVDGG